MKKSRAELILEEVSDRTDRMSVQNGFLGKEFQYDIYSTTAIADALGLQRTNVSKVLNELLNQKILIKVTGKPTVYFERKILETKLERKLEHKSYTRTELSELCGPARDDSKISPEEEKEESDVFRHIVGCGDTLKTQIALAKAAVTYPPMGLNTILIGSTGCGKSTFAEAMYQYGMSIGAFRVDAGFVVFNCADYAENPQLLVSQLFGSVKGAYTGADKEKAGLVDGADGGVLFLDEVHRLPKEGQEMLFTLMDKGVYRRVGETDNTRRAEVMIIVATTENKNSHLLNTFIRRIPITIEMPEIAKYSIQERLELIYKFFYAESLKTKRRIVVSRKILKCCLKYDCPLNIGGLKSDIQLICAKGYFSCVSHSGEDIKIGWGDIPGNMKMGLVNTDHEADTFAEHRLQDTVVFDYSKLDQSEYFAGELNKYEHENKYYNKIIEDYYESSVNPESSVDAREKVEENLKAYFRSVHEKIRFNQLPEYGEFLSKIVDEQVIEAVIEAVDSVSSIYNNPESNKRIVCALSLHINNLMERMKSGKLPVSRDTAGTVEQLYPVDFHAALKVGKIISKELGIEISSNEIMFITVLLHTMNEMNVENNISVLCIAHGNGVASSIAEVVNKLLEVDGLYALDMPLDQSVVDTLNQATEMVRRLDKGSGVVLLTDMGSLCDFDALITEETGIPTIALPNVTTLMALEITRRSYSAPGNLQKFYAALVEDGVVPPVKDHDLGGVLTDGEEERFIKALGGMLSFLDAKKINHALHSVLANMWNDFDFPRDKTFEYKFIMHCAFMVERSIKNASMPAKNLRYYYENRRDTLERMEQYFKPVCQQFGFVIEPGEYEAVIEMFDSYFGVRI